LAASYQRAIVGALVGGLRAAVERTGLERTAVVGGVAANSELRAVLPDAAFAPLALCTDNAAMIASCARFVEPLPYPRYLDLDAYASVALGRFVGRGPRRDRARGGGRPRAGGAAVFRRQGGLAGRSRRARPRLDCAALRGPPQAAFACRPGR